MKLALEDRVVLITGPAKGMGASITHAFAAEGCKLALMGRDTAAIAPVADEVKAGGGKAIVISCDLTDAKQCESAVAATRDAFGGRIDVLVNVAGGSGPIGKTGVQTTPEEKRARRFASVSGNSAAAQYLSVMPSQPLRVSNFSSFFFCGLSRYHPSSTTAY